MSTTETGKEAEQSVAELLRTKGHTIIALNWRTRWCEIDIISTHKHTVYFTEVKYRSSNAWGSGLAYITPKKLQQMQFAAEFWMSQQNWNGDALLQAAEVNTHGIELVEL